MLVLGLGLSVIAGLWIGRTWSNPNLLGWTTGLLSLGCGILVAVIGSKRSTPSKQPRKYKPPTQQVPVYRQGRPLPYLGELLVHKHRLITEKQLKDALEEQRRRGGRLGQILVAMGLLQYSQLAEVLEDQVSYGNPWRKKDTEETKQLIIMN